jgi:DNA-binding CsgD family transcriptional regulator
VSIVDRIERICGRGLDARAMRVSLLDELRSDVPFDAYAWLLTDPETCVGSAPLAETPSLADLPALIRLKYMTITNRWTSLASNTAATLAVTTSGDRSKSRMWRELLAGYGIDDVASVVFRDQYGCWGFLDLWRNDGTFSIEECAVLQSFAKIVTPVLRHSLVSTFAHPSSALDQDSGPAVLLLSDDLALLTQTPQTDAFLRALLPTDAARSPVPAAAYNVAGQLLAREHGVDQHPPWARVHLRDGVWVTLRAARIEKQSELGPTSIAVSIELTRPIERSGLYARVAGFTERESELLQHLIGGSDTRALADRLFMSEHTVQDHLKAMFAKSGVNARRMLIARATGLAG